MNTAGVDAPSASLKRVLTLLRQRTGHDFSLYKLNTLHRRIERRMVVHGVDSPTRYAALLEAHPQELDFLFRELLIGMTSFFRDPEVWQRLVATVLSDLLARQPAEQTLRAWIIGCSTGEEAYSLAMALSEAMDQAEPLQIPSVQIFATDLSAEAIDTARRGAYPPSICGSVSAARLRRFFTAHEHSYRIHPSIRSMVLFAQHDVVLDPPFTQLDLILCRNLLIYFQPTLQRRLLPLLHYSLKPDGVLVLGLSETIGRLHRLFAPIDARLRLYRRQPSSPGGGRGFLLNAFPPLSCPAEEAPLSPPNQPPPAAESLSTAVDQVLLQSYAPAAVLLNDDADVVYISGRIGRYLEPAAGKANWNVYAMAPDGLREPLYSALQQAADQHRPVQRHGLCAAPSTGTQLVDITVQAFREPGPLQGKTLVVFRDAVAPVQPLGGANARPGDDEATHAIELQQYRDQIERLRAQDRASREELEHTNEALQSTNEELQSANEELTTTKEETQSMNEELHAINNELQGKLNDLARAQSDMQNLLNSIDIAALFLDQDLNVRRYTERATQLFNLRENDLGRPLSELTTRLRYPELQEDALGTLGTLTISERQVLTTCDQRCFTVRIMPYRRLDNVIDGVVITIVDTTGSG
ncbi:MCP methyltransferase, CheR-type [Halorhodospira halophila SL1]|uniref:protein-glutamate O-methyltransferase n=1 Tax=Halorhodospira halophila (strain DSM 244 / SL1) TaxID=349124 RepID=A1WU02_HALHL|nr:MCP methyltransferase, CheR-type [Halorhodospira halophila SL1]